MFVLGDGENAVGMDHCNDLEDYDYGNRLYGYLLATLRNDVNIQRMKPPSTMGAGCYHQDSHPTNYQQCAVTFFPGHLDKAFVHTAWFVPLGTAWFFTIIALSRNQHGNPTQDKDSLGAFCDWKCQLSTYDQKVVDDFLQEFDTQGRKQMNLDTPPIRLIFVNKCGSVLSFPANQYYHATITPRKGDNSHRDLFIFHPLDGSYFER